MNKLYFGDNAWHLGESIRDESIDLIYLDPPFNSQAQYNIFFKTPEGDASQAQAEAFRDTWTWTNEAALTFDEIVRSGSPVVPVIDALRRYLKETDLMAYLVMMTSRLIQIHRVLKECGTIYLHCDPSASHYLKLVMDGIFGAIVLETRFLGNDHSRKGMLLETSQIAEIFYSAIQRETNGDV